MSLFLRTSFSRRPSLRTTLLLSTSLGIGAYTLSRRPSSTEDDLPSDLASLYYSRKPLQLDSVPFSSPSFLDGHGRPGSTWTPPTRAEMIDALRAADPNKGGRSGAVWDAIGSVAAKAGLGAWFPKTETVEGAVAEFDLLIVGGGATGAGVALDAASRGLKVALVERDDFSSGERSFFLSW